MIKVQFDDWEFKKGYDQYIADPTTVPTIPHKLKVLKPLCVEWATQSWTVLSRRTELILKGWEKSFNFIDPRDPAVQRAATRRSGASNFQVEEFVPDQEEPDEAQYNDADTDSEQDELDSLAIPRQGERRSTRERRIPDFFGCQLRTDLFSIADSCVDLANQKSEDEPDDSDDEEEIVSVPGASSPPSTRVE